MPPYNGSGTYVVPAGQPVVTGTTISSTTENTLVNDLAAALTNCITRDGQSPATANIPLGNNRLTGVANAVGAQDAVTRSQVEGWIQSGSLVLIGSLAGTNTLTGTVTPAISSYVAGSIFSFLVANTNTAAVTLNLNAIGAVAIVTNNGTALDAGDLMAGAVALVEYNGTNFALLTVTRTFDIGDATAPGIAGDGQADTGLFWPGSANLGVSAAGTERSRWAGTVFLHGKNSTSAAAAGVELVTNGEVYATRDGNPSLFQRRLNSDGAITSFFRDGSNVGSISVTTTATAYNTSSDARLKDQIEDYDSGNLFDQLRPRSFRWKYFPEQASVGFIAQELHQILPDAVTLGDGDPTKGLGDSGFIPAVVDYSKLVPYLVAEIKSLRARITALE